MQAETEAVVAYTDGACSGNPGPGAWGALLIFRGSERDWGYRVAYVPGAKPALELIRISPGRSAGGSRPRTGRCAAACCRS